MSDSDIRIIDDRLERPDVHEIDENNATWFGRTPTIETMEHYGMSVEAYHRLRDSQGGKCAICDREEIVCGRLVVDHDHATNRVDEHGVRGLLCDPCNTGLGLFSDDPTRLAAAVDYLQANGCWLTNPMTAEEIAHHEQLEADGIITSEWRTSDVAVLGRRLSRSLEERVEARRRLDG